MTSNRLFFLLACAVFVLAPPAVGQAVDSPAVGLEAEVGLRGWVEGFAPVPLSITITSDLLFAGTIEIDAGNSQVSVEAEVPAGGEKTYTIWISPPSARVDIELVPLDTTEPIDSLTIQVQNGEEAVLVGTLGLSEEPRLPSEVAIGLIDRPVEVIAMSSPAEDPGPLDYLLVGEGVTLEAHHRRWVSEGGTIVSASALRIGDDAALSGEIGAGGVLVVPNFEMSADEWEAVVIPVASPGEVMDQFSSVDTQMLQAAGQSNRSGLGRPGALVALGVYALVAAPINLILLKRLGKRELAWLTVPAISVVTAVAFLAIGAISADETTFAQATLVVGSGDDAVTHTVMVGTAQSREEHTITVGKGEKLYAVSTLEGIGVGSVAAERIINGSHTMTAVFPGPGYTTAGIRSESKPGPVVTLDTTGPKPVAHITNHLDHELIAYGVNINGVTSIGDSALPAGAATSLQLGGDFFFTPFDALIEQMQGDFDRVWSVFQPLSSVTGQVTTEAYFYGYVERMTATIDIDGRARVIDGPGVVVIPLPSVDVGSASGKVLDMGVDGVVYEGDQWFEGTMLVLSFVVAPGEDLELQRGDLMWGEAPSYHAWDWTMSEYVAVEDDDLDGRFVGETGEVLLQVGSGDNNDFFGIMVPSVRITWDNP